MKAISNYIAHEHEVEDPENQPSVDELSNLAPATHQFKLLEWGHQRLMKDKAVKDCLSRPFKY